MAEPPPLPPTTARRGPPPLPAGITEASERPALGLSDELYVLATDESARTEDPAKRAELRVRMALLAWDTRSDGKAAAAALSEVSHPAAYGLRRDLALAAEDAAALAALADEQLARPHPEEALELGELLLVRGDRERACALLAMTGEPGRASLAVALGVAEKFPELRALLERSDESFDWMEAAAIAGDRLGDEEGARALLRRAAEKKGGRERSEEAYLLERLLDLDGEGRAPRLQAKLELLGSEPGVEAERAATQFLLAASLEGASAPDRIGSKRVGVPESPIVEADALLAALVSAEESEESLFGIHLALHARARVQRVRRDFAGAAASFSALAERTDPSAWSRACARRAAEILENLVGDRVRAEAIFAGLHELEPGNPSVTRALLRLRLRRNAPAEAAAALEGYARVRGDGAKFALVAAARAGEAADAARRNAPPGSTQPTHLPSPIERWRNIAGRDPGREPLEALARAYRRSGERPLLAATYRRLAPQVDPRRAAAHLTIAGALLFDGGRPTEAAEAFAEAIDRDSSDLLAHAGRAACARAAGKPRDLSAALAVEVDLLTNPQARTRMLRELAHVASGELGDLAAAEAAYARALELTPDDPTTLYDLSRLSGDLGKWPRAVELRERAAAFAAGETAATWLCEVGEIYERHLSDDDRAAQAYRRALAVDGRARLARSALAALLRKHDRLPELLDVLRGELQLADGAPAQVAAHLAIADAAERGDAEVALSAYREALALDPVNAAALSGLERLCRAAGRWADLAEALARVAGPQASAKTLHSLGEAYEQLQDWAHLAEVREQEVMLPEIAANRREQARVARALAELYEAKLSDPDGAARAWHRVDEAVPDVGAVRALERIYQERGRFADLAAAFERELEHTIDNPRKLEVYRRLGELREKPLGRPGPAAEAWEQVLRLDGSATDALTALGELYVKLDRPRDLERVLERRATLTADPKERCVLLLQKGDLLERSSDLDGALAAFASAFKLDPTSRTAFTSLERVCYRRERWRDAMELYDRSIHLVEVQKSRAYRLADLYARKGQVQLQYLAQPGEAASSYLRVLELDPETDTAQTALERIFSAQSDWQGLIAAYDRRAQLVQDDTKRVEIFRRAARVAAAKLRDPRRAAEIYERLHAVDPTDAEALDALERHFEHSREWEKLVEVLRTRIALTTGGDDAIKLYVRIASLCEEGMRSPERAIEAYRKILDIAPSHREALDSLGRLYEGTEKWAELVEVTRRQIRVVTDRAQKAILYFKCGSVMESKFGKDDDAIRYYDAAIRTSPSCLPAVHGLRDLYLRREDWPRVVQSLELEAKLWTEEKERAGVLAHIGTIYGDKLHDVERAIWFFENALTVDKNCLAANRSLFDVYFTRGDYARALPLGQILTQKVMREGDPAERSEFYRKRAVVARETGDLPAAAESLVVSLEIRPDNVDSLDLLVELCRHHGEVYDFLGTFRELEKLYRKRDATRALARVLVALGALREREYEIDQAEQLYLEALTLAPDDFPVVDALVDLHMRLRRFDAGATVLEAFLIRTIEIPGGKSAGGDGTPAPKLGGPVASNTFEEISPAPLRAGDRAKARLRLAELYSDGSMDPRRAAEALRMLIAEQPTHREAHFRLAQELYLLGGYAEAQKICERLIQLAAAPGETSPPEDLARYYDYLGRIAEALGDPNGAARSYRRALDLDPAYAPPVLALARRAASAGDRQQGAVLFDAAARAAQPKGQGPFLAVQRGLARFLVEIDDRPRAVELYRRILADAPAGAQADDDRVALAALYARDAATQHAAREELHAVLKRDLRNAAAYRLLMAIYTRAGEAERAARVASILLLLGYAGGEEALPRFSSGNRRGTLGEDLRRAHLLPAPAWGPFTEALQAVREPLEPSFPYPGFADVQAVTDPGFRVCVVDVQRLLGVEAEVLLARAVPGGAIAFESPRPTVVLEAALAQRPDKERRFLLGRALEPLRGGYAMPLRLRPSERAELGHLLEQLLLPEARRDPQAQEFLKQLPRKSLRAVERLPSLVPAGGTPGSLDAWYAALAESCDRAGLVACDDLGAAAGMLARLGGEELAVTPEGAVALGQVAGGNELVRFYLSDPYHALRSALGDPTGG
jgi:lipopolysaccharide biosynthesis regulator YciM